LKPIQIWKPTLPACLYGITSDKKQVYVCNANSGSNTHLHLYTFDGQILINKLVQKFQELYDIDVYSGNLYIVDSKKIAVYTLQFQLLDNLFISDVQRIKVNKENIFLSVCNEEQIFVYTLDGTLKKKIGTTEKK